MVDETPASAPLGAAPYLLVMPYTGELPEGAVPAPAGWTLPVSLPPGTPGYAVFVPLVPVGTTLAEAAPLAPVPAPFPLMASTPPDDAPLRAEVVLDAPAQPETLVGAAAASELTAALPEREEAPEPVATAAPEPRFTAPFPYYPPQPQYEPWLQRRWPGPAPSTGWTVPLAVAVGGIATAVFTPLSSSGIGWLLTGLALVVGVALALARTTTTARSRGETGLTIGWTVAALALLAVPTFRNAWWLVAFCILGALGCAALAIIGGRRARSMLFSLVGAPFAALRGLPWVSRHLSRRADAKGGLRALWSVVITAGVLLVFGTLLRSADAAFSKVIEDLIPEINAGTVVSWVFLFLVGGLTAVAAVYTLAAAPDLSTMDTKASPRWGAAEWGLPIAALVLLFSGFVAVQFTVLFGGERHVLETAGLRYADYARSGFWQLAAVTVLTLAVLGAVTRWARRERPGERLALRILLGLLCALSVVIVFSALYRMYTYQQAYSFTGERIFVMAFELLLGIVFLLVMAAGIRWRGGWIPGITVALGVVMLLSLAVLNPEDYAARRNVDRYQETGKIDAWYLRALSADATPALTELPDPVRRCTLSWIARDLAEPDPWYAWNLGREQAREVLRQLGKSAIGGPDDCRAADAYDFPKTR